MSYGLGTLLSKAVSTATSAASTVASAASYVLTKADDALEYVVMNEKAMLVIDLTFTGLSGYNFYYCVTEGIIGTAAKMKTLEILYDTGIHTAEFVKDVYNAATGEHSSDRWHSVMGRLHKVRLAWAAVSTVTGTGAVSEMSTKVGSPININVADFGPHALLVKKNATKAAPAA